MSDALLLVTRLLLLGLLYVFLWRVGRVMAADLRDREGTRAAAPPRPQVAPTTSTPRSRPGRRPPRQLVVHEPSGAVTRIDLGEAPVRLGRTTEHPVDDDYVSDEHVEFEPDEKGWTVRDLGSTNGTFVDGAQVVGRTPVAAGDHVRIGKTRIEVRR